MSVSVLKDCLLLSWSQLNATYAYYDENGLNSVVLTICFGQGNRDSGSAFSRDPNNTQSLQ